MHRILKTSAAAADRIRPPRPGVVVLLYHRVGATSGLQVDLPTSLFDAQMEELVATRRVIDLDDALDRLSDPPPTDPGDRRPDAWPVVVTFDDGTADFVDVALPILVRHRVPAVLYVATDFIERGRSFPNDGAPASWTALSDARSTGLVTIGSHTHTHALMDRVPAAAAADELDRSRALIAERLGVETAHFAYPKAVAGSVEAEAAVRERFRSAAIAGTRPNPYGQTDPYRLTRSPIQVADGMRWFRRKSAWRDGTRRRRARRDRPTPLRRLELVTTPTAQRPRVVHVTTTDISLALLLGPQLHAFAEAGYDVIGASNPGRFSDALVRSGIRHVPLRHATRSNAPHRDAAAVLELRSLFRELRPDIVHTHNPKPGLYGRLAARWARVPVVVNTVHGSTRCPPIASPSGWSSTASSALPRAVRTPSSSRTPRTSGSSRSSVSLETGSRFSGTGSISFASTRTGPTKPGSPSCAVSSASNLTTSCAGRWVAWSPRRGTGSSLRRPAQLRERSPRLRFVVVGPTDPAKRDALTDADLRRAEAEANIRFVGERDDVEDLYALMDLFALPSHREGWPRSAMEAAAMGIQVIATDIRGCRQVVDDGVTGLLVGVGDADALARAIASLADDPTRRADMGRNARHKAQRDFDQQRVIETTLQVYERLLGASERLVAR